LQSRDVLFVFMNRRMPNGTYGGVRGRGREAPAYSILCAFNESEALKISDILYGTYSHGKYLVHGH
jgi:hypothetical protein